MLIAKLFTGLLVILGLTISVGAEEKIVTPSAKTKAALEKFSNTPKLVSQTLQDLGTTIAGKTGVNADAAASATAEVGEADQTPAPAPSPALVLGNRDPFRPFTLNQKPSKRRPENLSPLERYDLGQLKLVGVVWDIKEPNAVVEDSTGLGYVIRVGTPIGPNEGKVKTIHASRIVIEEFEVDVFGAKKKIERSMKLAPEKAE